MSAGEGCRDTWACDDSDKSPRRQNKARLPQICFQCSSVGELDDGWTGAGRNTSVSKLLTIIKTSPPPHNHPPSIRFPFNPATYSPTAYNPFHLISICLGWLFLHCSVSPSFLNSITGFHLSAFTLFFCRFLFLASFHAFIRPDIT